MVTASVRGDRYFSNDVNHSMGPALSLIGEEIDDSVDLTPAQGHVPSHCRLLGTMSSVSVMDTRFQICVQQCLSQAAILRHCDVFYLNVALK